MKLSSGLGFQNLKQIIILILKRSPKGYTWILPSVNTALKIEVFDETIKDIHFSRRRCCTPIPLYLNKTSEFLKSTITQL